MLDLRLSALALATSSLLACAKEPVRPPPAPPLDGSVGMCAPVCIPPPTDGGGRDLGSRDAASLDASASDGGSSGFCAPFPRAGSSLSRPIGFAPARVLARWDTDSCASPELVVAFTEGGCGLTDGERVELRFSEARVLDSGIVIGINTLFVDGTHPLRMRYVRTDAPSATVGPCGVGTVDIDMLALVRGGRFIANFDVVLNDCDLVGGPGIALVGAFDVPIAESSADACR